MNTITPTKKEAEFIAAYFEAINFTDGDTDEESDADQDYDKDFARESVIDCLAFYSSIACYLSDDHITNAGRDFWFTRTRHGAGFSDHPEIYGEARAKMFTTRAQGYGAVDAYYEERMA